MGRKNAESKIQNWITLSYTKFFAPRLYFFLKEGRELSTAEYC